LKPVKQPILNHKIYSFLLVFISDLDYICNIKTFFKNGATNIVKNVTPIVTCFEEIV